MNTDPLQIALRNQAAKLRNVQASSALDDQRLRDSADLLRVFGRILGGMPVIKAFGSPGDWGYDTEIGQAVAELRQGTCAGSQQ